MIFGFGTSITTRILLTVTSTHIYTRFCYSSLEKMEHTAKLAEEKAEIHELMVCFMSSYEERMEYLRKCVDQKKGSLMYRLKMLFKKDYRSEKLQHNHKRIERLLHYRSSCLTIYNMASRLPHDKVKRYITDFTFKLDHICSFDEMHPRVHEFESNKQDEVICYADGYAPF